MLTKERPNIVVGAQIEHLLCTSKTKKGSIEPLYDDYVLCQFGNYVWAITDDVRKSLVENRDEVALIQRNIRKVKEQFKEGLEPQAA